MAYWWVGGLGRGGGSEVGASSAGGSCQARKPRRTHWVPPPKVPDREEDRIPILPCGDK